MPELDEPVNVDLDPEDALRVLLGEERRELTEDTETDDSERSDEAE